MPEGTDPEITAETVTSPGVPVLTRAANGTVTLPWMTLIAIIAAALGFTGGEGINLFNGAEAASAQTAQLADLERRLQAVEMQLAQVQHTTDAIYQIVDEAHPRGY
jgi:hypothetical protein